MAEQMLKIFIDDNVYITGSWSGLYDKEQHVWMQFIKPFGDIITSDEYTRMKTPIAEKISLALVPREELNDRLSCHYNHRSMFWDANIKPCDIEPLMRELASRWIKKEFTIRRYEQYIYNSPDGSARMIYSNV